MSASSRRAGVSSGPRRWSLAALRRLNSRRAETSACSARIAPRRVSARAAAAVQPLRRDARHADGWRPVGHQTAKSIYVQFVNAAKNASHGKWHGVYSALRALRDRLISQNRPATRSTSRRSTTWPTRPRSTGAPRSGLTSSSSPTSRLTSTRSSSASPTPTRPKLARSSMSVTASCSQDRQGLADRRGRGGEMDDDAA